MMLVKKQGSCCNVAILRTNAATLQKQSIPTSRRCQTMSQRLGLVLGGLLAHFEPIIMGIKAQTQGIEGRTICDKIWSFLKERSPFLGWKHGTHLEGEKLEEEGD